MDTSEGKGGNNGCLPQICSQSSMNASEEKDGRGSNDGCIPPIRRQSSMNVSGSTSRASKCMKTTEEDKDATA
jgi:hypothetical protein